MKNLPYKIYLNFGDITKEEFEEGDYKEFCKIDEFAVTYCEDKVFDCDVEFVRKEALIEKAVDYIADNMRCNGYTIQTKAKFIEDFKKYIEK